MASSPTRTQWRKPPVIDGEVAALAQRYGEPTRRAFRLEADESIRAYRFGNRGDRRAEVVFAVQDPAGGLWVHAKANYPSHIHRLPSGGIHWDEEVEAALWREIAEETALHVQRPRFLGLIEYEFLWETQTAHFASYLFLVQSMGGVPVPQAEEAITDFRLVLPAQLAQLAADLRSLLGSRRGWGQWRALAHDLAYHLLAGHGESNGVW